MLLAIATVCSIESAVFFISVCAIIIFWNPYYVVTIRHHCYNIADKQYGSFKGLIVLQKYALFLNFQNVDVFLMIISVLVPFGVGAALLFGSFGAALGGGCMDIGADAVKAVKGVH